VCEPAPREADDLVAEKLEVQVAGSVVLERRTGAPHKHRDERLKPGSRDATLANQSVRIGVATLSTHVGALSDDASDLPPFIAGFRPRYPNVKA
jgi:hypothetical protein